MSQLPSALQVVFDQHHKPDAIFSALLPPLCEVLQCDRCFLMLRNPSTRIGKVAYCWRRKPDVPDMTEYQWRQEDEWEKEDPLFAAALNGKPSVYVEDVETADATVLNREFERKYFGHRALIHAHLRQDEQLWGILQPAVFGEPRVWSEGDRAVIAALEDKLAPLAKTYVLEGIKDEG
ncbi:GAF domain-containing protein [Oscillatoria sp. FACHB-1407]|uniref:GAF domain-containing protein n=1 Tax=Oscillatoria sp. FACHB-1407 TaxID=2692847 RepID=UPI001687692F|nr:GAF domain-containing protein [Oscillatoria sp. FACHB-1407]MBD2459541.1 GAF domain-containing protein [Oscillatoria sp. FACHB-1407]